MAEKSNRRLKKIDSDDDTRIKKIEHKDEAKTYTCSMCGTEYNNLKYFNASYSELYAGWNYHITTCRKCVDKLYEHYVKVYGGDEDMAIHRICQHFDMYYCVGLLNVSRKVNQNFTRINAYISKSNLTQYKNKTFDTTLDEQRNDAIKTMDEFQEKKENGDISTTKIAIERWGVGLFNDSEYSSLEEHYKMLKKNNPNADNNQEIFIKSLCHINLLMMKALKEKDLDGYTKANAEYGKTFKQAGLKTIEEKDSSNNDTVGVTLAVISQYTPEEYYKDKSLYKDYDELGEYYDRHIRRPMQNLITGSDIRDNEFKVPDDDGGDIDE